MSAALDANQNAIRTAKTRRASDLSLDEDDGAE